MNKPLKPRPIQNGWNQVWGLKKEEMGKCAEFPTQNHSEDQKWAMRLCWLNPNWKKVKMSQMWLTGWISRKLWEEAKTRQKSKWKNWKTISWLEGESLMKFVEGEIEHSWNEWASWFRRKQNTPLMERRRRRSDWLMGAWKGFIKPSINWFFRWQAPLQKEETLLWNASKFSLLMLRNSTKFSNFPKGILSAFTFCLKSQCHLPTFWVSSVFFVLLFPVDWMAKTSD